MFLVKIMQVHYFKMLFYFIFLIFETLLVLQCALTMEGTLV